MVERVFKSSLATKNAHILLLGLICSVSRVLFQIAENGTFCYFSQFLHNWLFLACSIYFPLLNCLLEYGVFQLLSFYPDSDAVGGKPDVFLSIKREKERTNFHLNILLLDIFFCAFFFFPFFLPVITEVFWHCCEVEACCSCCLWFFWLFHTS